MHVTNINWNKKTSLLKIHMKKIFPVKKSPEVNYGVYLCVFGEKIL